MSDRTPTTPIDHTYAFDCCCCGRFFKGQERHDEQPGGPRCPECGSNDRLWLRGIELIEAASQFLSYPLPVDRPGRQHLIQRFKEAIPMSAEADLLAANHHSNY